MPDRSFRLYDTLTRSVKPLIPSEPGHLRFYSCGPTVYSYAHIGNFRTFLTADLVVRTAEALGWRVSYVSNITDVGHLTSDDQEDGEDKMEKGLKSKEGERFVNVWDLADYYADCFKEDWDRLNLRRPLVWPRATQHMREQIIAVEKLIASGNAYETPTGVYFSVESFEEYGKLSGNRDRENLLQSVRNVVQDDNKRDPADFALWKKDDKHLMQWFSPWGWGFPGWHIECSVMAMQYLGETIDLHAGGEDLVFPHHECEIAQSKCLTHQDFCNHWMHTRFLQVDGEKMSKSLGNFYTARDLVDGKGVDPLALRYALIAVPYGKPLNFTLQSLRDATKNVERYRECERLARTAAENAPGEDRIGDELDNLYEGALDAMCDDMNTSVALAKALEGTGVIFREGATMSGATAKSALRYLERIGDLLGIVSPASDGNESTAVLNSDDPPASVIERADQRQQAKKDKDFALADRVRQEIEAEGWEIRDTPEGPQIKRKLAAI
jgi:cysteinyl-tRNA synthetase